MGNPRLKNKDLRRPRFDTPGAGHYDTAPMSRPGERLLDAESAATAGAVIEREFRIADFARLADRLARPEGMASVRMALSRIDGMAMGQLSVRAIAQLTCQRCLGPMRRTLESESALAFVADENAPVPEGREPVAGDTRRVDLAALVEDELLLALPLIARHAAGEACELPQAQIARTAGRETRRPFAGLKDLLKN
jgi:uncharacterized protein